MGRLGSRVKNLEEKVGIGDKERYLSEADVVRLHELEASMEKGTLKNPDILDLYFLRLKSAGTRFSAHKLLLAVEEVKALRRQQVK